MAKRVEKDNDRIMVRVPAGYISRVQKMPIGEPVTRTNDIISFKVDQINNIEKDIKHRVSSETGINPDFVEVEKDEIQYTSSTIVSDQETYEVPDVLANVLKPILNLFKKKDKLDNNPIDYSNRLYFIEKIGFSKAWKLGYAGNGIVVGVNDTGCGPNKYLKYNKNINTVGFNEPVSEKDNDYNSHGTHVAGTICSSKFHENKVIGAAWGSELCIFKSGEGGFYTSDLIQAFEEAVKLNVKVFNNSWGGIYSKFMQDTISNASDKMIIVKALGNESINCPDIYKNCISVSAIDRFDVPAKFSNWAPSDSSIASYGVDIFSTIPNNKLAYMSGTSMAAPLVTAAIAILVQKYHNINDARNILFSNCLRPLKDSRYGMGILDLHKEFKDE